jgi:hypothetical protein
MARLYRLGYYLDSNWIAHSKLGHTESLAAWQLRLESA